MLGDTNEKLNDAIHIYDPFIFIKLMKILE